MSYVKDLDEHTGSALLGEVIARMVDHSKGLCDYCHRPRGCKPECRFPERHAINAPSIVEGFAQEAAARGMQRAVAKLMLNFLHGPL